MECSATSGTSVSLPPIPTKFQELWLKVGTEVRKKLERKSVFVAGPLCELTAAMVARCRPERGQALQHSSLEEGGACEPHT